MLFPRAARRRSAHRLDLATSTSLPVVSWLGATDRGDDADGFASVAHGPGMPLLGEHARGRFTRPHLRGHRVRRTATWSTWFASTAGRRSTTTGCCVVRAVRQGRRARRWSPSWSRSLGGASARLRHTVTNTAPGDYVARRPRGRAARRRTTTSSCSTSPAATSVSAPRSGTPSPTGSGCARVASGVPGWAPPRMVVLGTPGFSTTHGERARRPRRAGAATRCCGSSATPRTGTTHRRRRAAAAGRGACWRPGASTPRRGSYVAAADDGLDGLAAVWHAYQRSLDAHPAHQPVVLNVWEAVYFDHDLDRLQAIADRAARVGVERFVLDDGWFHDRRDDTAGLGDWWVDPSGVARRAGPARRPRARAGHGVRALVRAGDGQPRLRPLPRAPRLDPVGRRPGAAAAPQPAGARPVPSRGAATTSSTGCSAVLSAHPIDYVKWDHNRDLLEAGSRRARRRPGRARADPGVLRPARPAARGAPRRRLGVVRLGRRAHRPRRARAGAAGLDLRHDRRPGAPADPALDHPAGRAGVRRRARLRAHLAHHRAHAVAGLPGRDGAVRRVRHRVGPDRGLGGGARPARRRGSSATSGSGRCCTPGRVVRPESRDPAVLLHGVVAADRARGAGRARAARRVGAQPRRLGPRARASTRTATYDAAPGRVRSTDAAVEHVRRRCPRPARPTGER